MMGTTPESACRVSYHLRHRLYHDRTIRDLVDAGEAHAEPVFPVRLCKGYVKHEWSRRQVGRGAFVVSEAEAADTAREVYGEQGRWESGEWEEAFRSVPDDVLILLARSVWRVKKVVYKPRTAPHLRGRLGELLPGLWAKVANPARMKLPLQKMHRREITRALRLAMLDPEYGTDWKSGRPQMSIERQIEAVRELHGPNIGADKAEVILRQIGGPLLVFTANQRRGVELLAQAYGLDLSELSWVELAALWEGGPQELEMARLQRQLGRRDMLERAIRK